MYILWSIYLSIYIYIYIYIWSIYKNLSAMYTQWCEYIYMRNRELVRLIEDELVCLKQYY